MFDFIRRTRPVAAGDAERAVRSARRTHGGWQYRANVTARTIAGTLGAYGVAALTAAMLARTLPMSRVEAVTSATMIAYLVGPAVTVWAFLARGPVRALGAVIALMAILALIAHLAGRPA